MLWCRRIWNLGVIGDTLKAIVKQAFQNWFQDSIWFCKVVFDCGGCGRKFLSCDHSNLFEFGKSSCQGGWICEWWFLNFWESQATISNTKGIQDMQHFWFRQHAKKFLDSLKCDLVLGFPLSECWLSHNLESVPMYSSLKLQDCNQQSKSDLGCLYSISSILPSYPGDTLWTGVSWVGSLWKGPLKAHIFTFAIGWIYPYSLRFDYKSNSGKFESNDY